MTRRRPSAVALRQPKCSVCAVWPVAMRGVSFCFGCWPGGPVTAPPCLRCGATSGYWTSGICRRCHKDADAGVDSCLDCCAWGATRHHSWLCRGCASWRRYNPTVAPCPSCGRHLHLGNRGRGERVCRLCYKQAAMMREPRGELDVIGANRRGQQLFFADMFSSKGNTRVCAPAETPEPIQAGVRAASGWEQPALFAAHRDLSGHGRAGLPPPRDPRLAADLRQRVADYGARLGWTERITDKTWHGIRILLGMQDKPGAPIKATDVDELRRLDLPMWTVRAVLAEAGMLDDDRTPAFDAWFAAQIADFPEPMASELRVWFDVMKNGSPTPPRRRPRSPTTIGVQLRWALPFLRAWAATGHTSLREISREQVLDALPAAGNPRSTAGQGLKSIFRLLKARRILFSDPTLRVKTGGHQESTPLPADLAPVREALHCDNPARAAVAALIAFHGLRNGHLQRMLLTDIRDGRLHVDGRVITLAEPVLERIAAYLDYRNRRWPNTTNPHLFVHYRSAGRTDPVGARWVRLTLGPDLPPASIREDRILNEAHATGGDVKRLAELFGLSVKASSRYTATIAHPDLTTGQHPADPGTV